LPGGVSQKGTKKINKKESFPGCICFCSVYVLTGFFRSFLLFIFFLTLEKPVPFGDRRQKRHDMAISGFTDQNSKFRANHYSLFNQKYQPLKGE